MRHRRGRLVVAALVLLCVSLVAAACSSDEPDTGQAVEATPMASPVPAVSSTPAASPTPEGEDQAESAVDSRAGESIVWQDCGGVDCGGIFVPVDYSRPDAGELFMAVLVHRATDPENRVGYLFVNPGGPGESGLDYAFAAVEGPGFAFTAEVIKRFDIVGFDPRGVGESEPLFECGQPGEQLALLADVDPAFSSPEDIAAGEAAVDLCIESMGPAAGLLHTANVVRDMDELRKALGAEQISYLGVSYGSAVGVWYATLFPDSVRAMVVDGADNPVDDMSTREARIANTVDELAQFELQLGEALDACTTPDCPIYNDGDPRGYFLDNVDRLDEVAAAAGGNPLAGPLGVITTLYSQDDWPKLWQGLSHLVERGDPAVLAELAAIQLGDSPGGTSIATHVNCLDSWVLDPQLDRQVRISDQSAAQDAVDEAYPLIGAMDLSEPDTCPFYDLLAPPPLEGHLDGSRVPILVIGNPFDPATPFTESEELATQTLSNGYLLKVDHPAHGVLPDNPCANDVANALLINLELPAERISECPSS